MNETVSPPERQRANLLDLVPPGVDLQLSPSETPEDGAHRRHKDLLLFYTSLGFVIVLAVLLVWVTFVNVNATDQQRQWGWTGITAIVAALVGYLFGKASKNP